MDDRSKNSQDNVIFDKEEVLKNFMEEFFPFDELQKAGFFTEEMKDNYQAQADKVCNFFGYKTVYEYGNKEVWAHLSYSGKRPKNEPFITFISNIYE